MAPRVPNNKQDTIPVAEGLIFQWEGILCVWGMMEKVRT